MSSEYINNTIMVIKIVNINIIYKWSKDWKTSLPKHKMPSDLI